MATPKINVPSPQFILNMFIAWLIIAFVARVIVPDQYKQYFRI